MKAPEGTFVVPPAASLNPFNLGLIRRALRETIFVSMMFAGVLAGVSGLLAYALPRIQERFMRRQFIPPGVREFRNAIFGFDGTGARVSDIAFALAWSHPIILTILAAHAILVCTRVLAGEVERGTVDVLLALPVSRTKLLFNEIAAWMITAGVVLGGVYGGCWIGCQFVKVENRPDFGFLLIVLLNLWLVYAAIGSVALLAASLTDRRTRAVMAALILTVFSLLINFLYLLDSSLEFTKALAPLSFLEYYKPINALMSGEWPVRNMLILGGVVSGLWIATLVVIRRRDVTTT